MAKAKKELSKARTAALSAVKNAKSDQEKAVAKQQLKLVRFQEVASIRTDAVLRAVKNLRNACDSTAYAWTDDQAKKIIGAVQAVWGPVEGALLKPGSKIVKREKFTL